MFPTVLFPSPARPFKQNGPRLDEGVLSITNCLLNCVETLYMRVNLFSHIGYVAPCLYIERGRAPYCVGCCIYQQFP